MDKNVLKQYTDLKEEIKDVQRKIANLEAQLSKLESEGTVIDTVTGGSGGIQHYKIEGFPSRDYSRKKTLLYSRKTTLELLEGEITEKIVDVESFIASINDSYLRRIVNYRVVEGLSWNDVAAKIGGGNTEDGVRMAYNRFLDKK